MDQSIFQFQNSTLQTIVEQVCQQETSRLGGYELDGSTNKSFLDSRSDEFIKLTQQAKIIGDNEQKINTSYKIIDHLEKCFDTYDKSLCADDDRKDFASVQAFILEEEGLGRKRREEARNVEAAEEKRLALEIATVKGSALRRKFEETREELQRKISAAERSYFRRKMNFSKASMVASEECRLQASRARQFFQEIHDKRLNSLRSQYQRTIQFQKMNHSLSETDQRVIALEEQIANRLYQKKVNDLNEQHMAQNLEEALYLEDMLTLLNKVQNAKSDAARDLFELTVQDLRARQRENENREDELEQLQACAKLELDALVAFYKDECANNEEDALKKQEKVFAIERRKGFEDIEIEMISASHVYDTILWSAAIDHLGLSTTGSSTETSDVTSELFDNCEDEDEQRPDAIPEEEAIDLGDNCEDGTEVSGTIRFGVRINHLSDGASTADASSLSGAVASITRKGELSPPGHMHVKQLIRQQREREVALLKRHNADVKKEGRRHRAAVRALRKKHQLMIDGLVEDCISERRRLRGAIEQRMKALTDRQAEETKKLRSVVDNDFQVMQDALLAETNRLVEAEAESFTKAQALVSAQVFHEVRNALSSIIVMSEMTSSLKDDPIVDPKQLVRSIDEMMEQIGEIVAYVLKMLNNVLDVSKINTGSFQVNNRPVNLDEVVANVTKTQLAKARQVKMSFTPSTFPCNIAHTDSDVLVRIITNLLSNSVKFTPTGAIQPFVWPAEDVLTLSPKNHANRSSNCLTSVENEIQSDTSQTNTRQIAVGVADTGPGLCKETFLSAQNDVLSNSTRGHIEGIEGSGFGLYLSHILAKALKTKLRLSTLDQCKHLLNDDMLEAMKDSRKNSSEKNVGAVIFVTVPVYTSTNSAEEDAVTFAVTEPSTLSDSTCVTNEEDNDSFDTRSTVEIAYRFCPRPSPNASTFRILVADDVPMLRKGLINTICSIFSCPVSIYTTCTAEDVLRAASELEFDMIVSDHMFDHQDLRTLNQLSSEETRMSLVFDGNADNEFRRLLSQFCKNERFRIKDGDGHMTGLAAMSKLAKQTSVPLLVVLSGHKLSAPEGVEWLLVTQKPLKRGDFISLLEQHAHRLAQTPGWIFADNRLVNRYGSQLFERIEEVDPET